MKIGVPIVVLIYGWLSVFTPTAIAQNDSLKQDSVKYLIWFTDKNNSPYTLLNPKDYLSDKAISRREKQGIALEENDIPVNPQYINSILASGNIILLNTSKWLNAITIYTKDTIAIDNIQLFPFVNKIDTVQKISFNKTVDKFEIPSTSLEYNKNNADILNYGASYNQINSLTLNYLHAKEFRGKNVTIAVLDAGFYNVQKLDAFYHLWERQQLKGTWNFVTRDSIVFQQQSHGLYVLSTMAALAPGEIIGTAPDANYWLLVSEEGGSENPIEEFNWAVAAEFADSVGADIINSSLGYNTFNDATYDYQYSDMDGNTTLVTIAADIASSKGILVVNSAGNEGKTSWQYIIAPADGDSVLAVGAIDANGDYANFSSKGPSYDGRVKPNVVAQGHSTAVISTTGNIVTLSGTSFASPLIAGAAACLWQTFPDKNNMDIISAIEQSASQYYSPDSLLGYGIPNFYIAYQILHPAVNDSINQLLDVFPNPFINQIDFMFVSAGQQTILIELIDMLGREVYFEERQTKTGFHKISIYSPAYPKHAIYILKVSTGKEQFIRKVIKNG